MSRAPKPDTREARLAEALRANLRRRKQAPEPKPELENGARDGPGEGRGPGEA